MVGYGIFILYGYWKKRRKSYTYSVKQYTILNNIITRMLMQQGVNFYRNFASRLNVCEQNSHFMHKRVFPINI